MRSPSIRHLVASPAGDIPVDTYKLDYPLEADPLKTPYRIYFRTITEFLTRDNYQPLLQVVNDRLGTDFDLTALDEIIIRTEKHGALYHPASIECVTAGKKVKFGLNVAVTETGKNALKKEFGALRAILKLYELPYIPKAFLIYEAYSMVFLLEEWFEGYHEFHITKTEDGKQQMKLWEYGKGDRLLSSEQCFEIYRQAAKILTLYYDLHDFRLIFPWHHAAGDFVVKISDNNQIDVRLTTVRGYEPFMGFDENDMPSPALALFYFLMHLSMQMRLDRFDGVGDVAWADDFCIDATVTGFLDGLERKGDFSDCYGSAESFLILLKSFTKKDLGETLIPIIEQFEKTRDYRLIQGNLEDHVARLYLTLQNYP